MDDSVTSVDQRLAILLSTDESRVFTFSSGKEANGEKKMDCRLDVWDSTDLTAPLYEKGERSI